MSTPMLKPPIYATLDGSERDHQTMAGYVKYLNDYAEHFRLRPHIRCVSNVS